MSSANAEQIGEWNGVLGQRWAEMQREIDGIVVPFGNAAMKLAAPQQGEQVIDIGCGCGDTTFELARAVGAGGRVLGVDVSRPMLDVAMTRARAVVSTAIEFREADASTADLPGPVDLLFSRFGVMFFDQPVPAFAHLRQSLREGGRLVFVCWRTPRDNAWAMTPLVAARTALGIVPAPADPIAPGPFAFADDERVRRILGEAGFGSITIDRFDAPIRIGDTPRAAAENAARVGPTARLIRDAEVERQPTIVDAIEQTFAPLAVADGSVHLPGSTWIVSARNAR
ncbi:MAG: class I SAM-dependent methyltransferase [Caldimonas sp.]